VRKLSRISADGGNFDRRAVHEEMMQLLAIDAVAAML
jgi:hypothetical protein